MLEDYIKKDPVTVSEEGSLEEVARLMREKNVGSVVVVKDHDIPTAIITDRDIVTRLLAKEVSLEEVCVKDVASQSLLLVKEDQCLDDVLEKMSEKAVRRAPVVSQEGKLMGVVSLDDVIVCMAERLQKVLTVIQKQLEG